VTYNIAVLFRCALQEVLNAGVINARNHR